MTPDTTNESFILRDRLAINRTILANERTLLAYIRTALALLITSLTLMKFFPQSVYQMLAYVFLVLSGVTVIIGFLRFHKFKRSLHR